jgi:hypothetical protein
MAAPRKKHADVSPAPDVPTQGIPPVYDDLLASMMSDLTELVTWWQERKATLHQARDASRETERTTFHVERRWVEAIRRQADLDHLTITQVVNEAFRHYFEHTALTASLEAGEADRPPTSRPDARGLRLPRR